MRIAILGTRGIPARYGGFESFTEHLAVGLVELGFDVTVFCEAGQGPQPDQWNGVHLKYVSAPPIGHLQTIYYDACSLFAARKGYDLVYMLGYGAAPFCLIPRFCGTETWINPDGLEWARAKWGKLGRLYFRLMEWICVRVASRIVADASAIEESLASRHGKLKACTVIPYGCEAIDTPPSQVPLARLDLSPDDYYLVVCRLEPENHVREILRAFQASRSKRTLLVIGNHASGTKYVRSLLEVKDPRIRMIGAVYDREMLATLRYYSFAHFHGHSVGGTNPSLLEAMGCGNFVLAHDNPFNRETLAETGMFFASAEALTHAINAVDRNPSIRISFKEAARARARQCYSWPQVIATYAHLLRREPVSESATVAESASI